jgi:hypothetical protein
MGVVITPGAIERHEYPELDAHEKLTQQAWTDLAVARPASLPVDTDIQALGFGKLAFSLGSRRADFDLLLQTNPPKDQSCFENWRMGLEQQCHVPIDLIVLPGGGAYGGSALENDPAFIDHLRAAWQIGKFVLGNPLQHLDLQGTMDRPEEERLAAVARSLAAQAGFMVHVFSQRPNYANEVGSKAA